MDRLIKKLYRPFVLLITLLLVFSINMSFAQEQITELDEVEITASHIQKYGVGSNISEIDTVFIEQNKQSSLAHLLTTQSSVYIKQYGAGMLSTIAFRGTGAGHTTFQWNGLQVGYPFLGQADLSLMPLDFIDEINLVHGSASARFGTGAIGGTVDMRSNFPVDGFAISAMQSFGSFGAINSTLQISQSGGRGYFKIGGFYKQAKNDFPFKSSTGKPLGNQKNADYSISGIQLNGKINLKGANSLDFQLQTIMADRNLQASIGSTSKNNQIDNNVWSSLQYKHLMNNGFATLQYGFLYDEINYNGSNTTSNQHKAIGLIELNLLNNLSSEFGASSTWVKVNTPFYENSEAHEIRANLYGSILWLPINRLKLSLNLRKAFVTDYTIPFTPSLGIDFDVVRSPLWQLNAISQLAKGYKVPTLNDRFWVPGGNSNLAPEESINAEVGFQLRNTSDTPFWIKTTTYQLWVNNWILWLPNGAIWSPENKRKVKGVGLEFESGIDKQIGDIGLKGWMNYAYTRSTNREALDEYDRSADKQLPYVPFHNGNFTGQLSVGKWQFQLNTSVTGKRFITTDNETEVPGYALLNIRTSYYIKMKQWDTRFYLDANNITNTNYQSIINKAMPGINFLAGAQINFNK